MSEQDRAPKATTTEPKPAPDGYSTWNDYWTQMHNQPWRTEPEIDERRQHYLGERRAVAPDIQQGIYPFRDENGSVKLTRADVEWLLATHESGGVRGPVDWSNEKKREREGLDLRGADLRAANLSNLPLARVVAGLPLVLGEARLYNRAQRRMAVAHLEGTILENAHLEGGNLNRVRLDEADLRNARLEQAVLYAAHLEGANLNYVYLAGGDLRRAYLDQAAYLYQTTLSDKTYGGIWVQNTRWNEANLTVARLDNLRMLGDEREARSRHSLAGKKTRQVRRDGFAGAVRANRQFAMTLRTQGLNEDADRFSYRAQLCQRIVLRRQGKLLRYLGSLLLDTISGYGYRPLRSFVTYLVVVGAFAVAYYVLGNQVNPPLSPLGAVVFSITSFHGRGFAPGENVLITNPLTVLAAGEAIIGLLIEITFIATFTQRFFAR